MSERELWEKDFYHGGGRDHSCIAVPVFADVCKYILYVDPCLVCTPVEIVGEKRREDN